MWCSTTNNDLWYAPFRHDTFLFSKRLVAAAFVHGAPDNAFCKLERGEIVLSEVCYSTMYNALIVIIIILIILGEGWTIIIIFVHLSLQFLIYPLPPPLPPPPKFFILFKEECRQLAIRMGVALPSSFSPRDLFSQFRKEMRIVPEMIAAVRKLKGAGGRAR